MVFEFQRRFPDEDACFKYLYDKKWPNGFKCPQCGHDKAYQLEKRKLMQCSSCKYQASVTAGTAFHKLRQSLFVLLWACYWVATTKKGISALELKRKLGLRSYQTAWLLLHKIREAMRSSGRFPLEYNVEFDETFLGLPEDSPNQRRALVKAVVETDGKYIGRAYLEHLQSQHKKTNQVFINKTVVAGSIVKTDGSPSFKFLKNNYQHLPYKMYDKKDNNIHLPKVHIVFGNLKMWLRGTYNQMPYKHAQRYLNEFCFRFNRRWRLHDIFDLLISRAVNSNTITFAELTG